MCTHLTTRALRDARTPTDTSQPSCPPPIRTPHHRTPAPSAAVRLTSALGAVGIGEPGAELTGAQVLQSQLLSVLHLRTARHGERRAGESAEVM